MPKNRMKDDFHPVFFGTRRYRLLAKLQLTEPGKGRHPGLLRNYLADANCDAAQIRATSAE